MLLAALPSADRVRLTDDHPPVDLTFSETLNEPGDRIRHVYFPIDSFISLIAPGEGRAQLEIGLVGNEGMLGVPLLLGVTCRRCAPWFRVRVARGASTRRLSFGN